MAIELPPAGYEIGAVIGRGGMGEVLAARDLRIGREVAVKRMHGEPSPRAVTRFMREARIQARLDHPAIVPVHELGVDPDGRPFFTMKRLAGRTLEAALADLSTPALLRAITEVCLAIDLAHARSVVHRDLKPANIMLGDYGEVYILDWGVARELGEEEVVRTSSAELTLDPTATRDGTVLGTPGYIPPEQVRGEPVGTAADVYALGAILFEILTGDRLHPRGQEALVSTLTGDPDAPSKRTPERAIAPELDELCRRALADDPAERPTAHDFANQLQRYLDGDRDLERRRTLAAEQLALARAATERTAALRHAGRALALDPESPDAAAEVTRLLVERPTVLPEPLVAELAQLDRDALKTRSVRAAGSYGIAGVFFLAWLPFLEITSTAWLAAFYGVLLFMVAFAWLGTRHGNVSPLISMAGNCALAFMWTRVASPFVLAPVMVCGALIAVSSHPWNQRRPWTVFAWAAITIGMPFALEAAGVLESTWSVAGDALHAGSAIFALDGMQAAVLLFIGNLLFVVLVGGFALIVTARARNAQRELHIQAWHLRHLLPA